MHRKHNIQIKLPSPVRPARCPRSWDFGGATGAEYLTLTLGMRVDVAISSTLYVIILLREPPGKETQFQVLN